MATVLPAFNPVAGIGQALAPAAQLFQQKKQRQQSLALAEQARSRQLQDLIGLSTALQSGQPIDPSQFNSLAGAQAAFGIIQQQQQSQQPQAQAELANIQARTGFTQAQTGQVGQPTPLDPITAALRQGQLANLTAQTSQVGKAKPLTAEDKAFKVAQTAQIKAETKQIALLTPKEQRDAALINAGLKIATKSKLEIDKTRSEIFKNQANAAASLASANPDKKLTAIQKVSTASGFRKEFNALDKDFRDITVAFDKIKAVTNDPSAAGDIALIFNYMKILDPGSTVREGEFATAENAASVPDAIRNMWNKAITGERIAFNRADFRKQAENLFNSQKISHDRDAKRYTSLAKKHGIDPQDVIGQPIAAAAGANIPISELSDAQLDALINQGTQ